MEIQGTGGTNRTMGIQGTSGTMGTMGTRGDKSLGTTCIRTVTNIQCYNFVVALHGESAKSSTCMKLLVGIMIVL